MYHLRESRKTMDMEGRRNKGDYYPLFLNLKGKNCLVVGGGRVALRKVTNLIDHGASVTVISPFICSSLQKLAETEKVKIVAKQFTASDIADFFMVIAATSDNKTNRQVAAESQRRRVLVNVVDDASLSDFIFPALLSRHDLTIAVSTGGKSPALSRKLRDHLEQHLEKEYSTLIEIAAEVRAEVRKKRIAVKKDAWQYALDIEALISLLQDGQKEQAKSFLMDRLVQPDRRKQ
jgi:siroheme synthase-like protein